MNREDSDVVQLTKGSGDNRYPKRSANGNELVFMAKQQGEDWQIYSMNADETNRVRLTENGANDDNPDWSPDDRQIMFESDRDGGNLDEIYVMNPDGGEQKRLTHNND